MVKKNVAVVFQKSLIDQAPNICVGGLGSQGEKEMDVVKNRQADGGDGERRDRSGGDQGDEQGEQGWNERVERKETEMLENE